MRTISFGLASALLLSGVCFAPADGAAPAPAPKAKGKDAPAPATAGGFVLETGIDIPARTRFGGEGTETSYPFADMTAGQSFLMPVSVPETIKDEKEKAKAFKEEARKLSNRISGAIRRFKKNNPGANFAVRTVDNGVRVWRTEAETTA